ncbi:MAG: T9SS type A sorting domain-containing protein, partial [Candidatus Zixiibacteriota bacterium]
ELIVCNVSNGGRVNIYENQGNFNFIEIYESDPGIVYDSGDPDGDGLNELLVKLHRSIYLYEQYEFASLPESLVWYITPLPGNHECWPQISDLDFDGQKEITFSMQDTHNKIRIFENNGDNSYIERTPIIWLVPTYPADYANGDFDGDGYNEVLCGGIYGHLAIQENVTVDLFEVTWQGELGHPNALLHENIGDYDQDGRDEWVSAGKDFSAGGFFFKVFDSIGDNQYETVYYDSLPGNTWDEGGISAGDVDGDGINEFLVSSNNNIGLYKYSSDHGWGCVWLTDEGGSGAVLSLPFLLDIDSDGLDEIIITGNVIRTRIYDLVPTHTFQSTEPKTYFNLRVYPNPANNKINFTYNLPNSADVTLEIYDILGRKVQTLIDEFQSPDSYAVTWDVSHIASGMYFYRLQAEDYTATRRMSIIK